MATDIQQHNEMMEAMKKNDEAYAEAIAKQQDLLDEAAAELVVAQENFQERWDELLEREQEFVTAEE